MCPGLVSHLGFNVMGGLILLLDLSYIPPGGWRGGGAVVGSLSVPVFPWDFHKTQPYQVSIRSKNAPLASQALITASICSGSRLSTSAKKFQVLGPRLCTRILLRAMIGLLKIPF